jgi:hypothetical protein
VTLQESQFLLAPSDEGGVALAEAVDVEGTSALLDGVFRGLRAELLDRVEGKAYSVDVELGCVAVGGGEGELVVVSRTL